MLGKEAGKIGGQRINQDQPKHSSIKTIKNTFKRPGNVTRLAVTQTSVENHQLKMKRQTPKENNNNNFQINDKRQQFN